MAPRIQFDPLPPACAGILTVRCACGWEMVFVLPEEQMTMLHRLFAHLVNVHQLTFPEIQCEWH